MIYIIGASMILSVVAFLVLAVIYCPPSKRNPNKIWRFLLAGRAYYCCFWPVLFAVYYIYGYFMGGKPPHIINILGYIYLGMFSFFPLWGVSTLLLFLLKNNTKSWILYYSLFLALLLGSVAVHYYGTVVLCSMSLCYI